MEATEELPDKDPFQGKVRVTMRMQWDTTIASFEVFIPVDQITEHHPAVLFEGYCGPLFGHTLEELKARSVERMLLENGVS